ncbi:MULTISPECIES: hypothetical protein [Sphingobacterium]|nr:MULTISPECIES: hypothetical protein [unclassified Sphingobacterium]
MEKINTKLSKQNFRYLDETEISSPLSYLLDFYTDKIDFAT